MIKTAMPTHTAISYTLTRPGLPHLLYQILAIPTTHITSGAVEAAFHAEAASWGVAITSETYDGQDEDEGFRVWIPEGEGEKKLSIRLQPGDMFPAQFGRMVLAKVLEVSKRAPTHLVLFHCHSQLGRIIRFPYSLIIITYAICYAEYLANVLRLGKQASAHPP